MRFPLVAVSVLITLASALSARAGFVMGTEHFNGTQLDTNTWEFFTSNPGLAQAVQNDNLVLGGANGRSSDADYTTLQKLVHPGQSVRVDTVLNDSIQAGNGNFALFLTNNSLDAKGLTIFDSQWLQLSVRQSEAVLLLRGGDGSGAGTSLERPNHAGLFVGPGLGTPVTYQIDYLTRTSARFAAFNELGDLLADTTLNFDDPLPRDLAISLAISSGATVTFDNVNVSPIAVPLPAAAVPGACVLLLIFGVRTLRRKTAA
jgi:hypothetical protein